MEEKSYREIAEAAGRLKAAADRVNGAAIAIDIPAWVQAEILAGTIAAAEALDEVQTAEQWTADKAKIVRLQGEVTRLEAARRDQAAALNADIEHERKVVRELRQELFCAQRKAACATDPEPSQCAFTNPPTPPQGAGDRQTYVNGYNAGVLAQRRADAVANHREPCD
jgi:hypothetical protein